MQLRPFLAARPMLNMVAFYDLCAAEASTQLEPGQNKSQKIQKYRDGVHVTPPEWIHLIEMATRKIVATELGIDPESVPPDEYVRAQDWVDQHLHPQPEQAA
jgi:hypothetical protein